jgi:hypothetical protein
MTARGAPPGHIGELQRERPGRMRPVLDVRRDHPIESDTQGCAIGRDLERVPPARRLAHDRYRHRGVIDDGGSVTDVGN